MKRIIIVIITCVSLSYKLYAQQEKKDYNYYNHWIDSLTLNFSMEKYVDIKGTYVDFDDSNLSTKEKKKLIDKIEKLFQQKEYANLYRLGHRIIYDMWQMSPDNNSPEIKQMLMELYLRYYFYPGAKQIIDCDKLGCESYYTKKAKKRIVEILEGKKTREEYDIYLKLNELTYDSYPILWKEAAQIMKKREIQNDTVLKQVRDSIMADYVYRNTESFFESLQIEPKLIKMIGLLDMKECIPILQQNLLSCPEEQNRTRERAYRWALARLGDKEQRQYIMDNFMNYPYFNRSDFAYFRDEEMIWKYIDVNYFSKEEIPIISGFYISSSLKTMSDIYRFLIEVPEELKIPIMSNDMNDYYKWAEKLYNWLVENKQSIKFDYEEKRDSLY